MKTFKLLLVAFAFTAFAQVNAQTAEEIVANYFENTGGLDNWKKIKGIKFEATVNQMGMEIPIEMVQLSDGRMATTITFQGKEIKQGVFDGETLWNTNFMSMKAEKSDPEALELVRSMYASIPMQMAFLDAKEHDVHTAYVSHISHISSFALALTVLEKEKNESRIFELASSGFGSTVRLAKSSAEMWIPIFRQNRDNVLDVLDEHINQLSRFRSLLIKNDFETFHKLIKEANTIKRMLS